MSWGKFDDEYYDNPKCRAAGKDGRALDAAGILHCAKHLTDGLIPDHDLPILAAKAEVNAKRTVRRLVDVGRWHGPGHDCPRCADAPPGFHVVHDYLDFHPDAEKERAKRQARADAGRKGGQLSRPPGTKQEANPEANASANGEADSEANRNPVPVPTDVNKSSSELTSAREAPDDDDQSHQDPPSPWLDDPDPPPDQVRHEPVTETALAVLAQHDLDERQQNPQLPPIGDPVRWLAKATRQRRERHASTLAELRGAHPDWTPQQLAATVDQPTNQPAHRTADGTPFIPGIGIADGAQHVRNLLTEPLPDDAQQAAVRDVQDGIRNRLRRPRQDTP